MDDDLERVRHDAIETYAGRTSIRWRVLDWATAIVVALGVVASIPMIPIVVIGWLVLIMRSPRGGFGVIRATMSAAQDGATGKLEGFSGPLLFPLVAAGWLLIAFLGAGFVGGGFTGPGTGIPGLAWLAFLCLFIGPTFVAYRSMHPEISGVPFDEWLGSRRPGPIGIALLAWFACVLVIGSIARWIPAGVDLGPTGFVVVLAVMFGSPLIALPMARRWPGRVLGFVGIATLFGIVTFVMAVAGILPDDAAS